MTKINMHIEIVSSSISWLSSMGHESREAILTVLAEHYTKVGITIVNTVADLEGLVTSKPDLVFLGMKFVSQNHELGMEDPDKIWLAEYLDAHDIAYTGSDHLAHELELNKDLAKQRVLDAGLQTSPFFVARQNQPLSQGDISLELPLFVKPTNRGGGQGIDSNSVVHDFAELEAKVASITANVRSDSLVEQYLPGREFSVAILQHEVFAEPQALPIELIAPLDDHGTRLLGSQVKSSNVEQAIEVTDMVLKARVTALTIDVFRALGARDYGRIDIRLDEFGAPHFLEANLLPSLIDGYGSFPKACLMNVNLGYETMILRIAELGLARKLQISSNTLEFDITNFTVPLLEPALG